MRPTGDSRFRWLAALLFALLLAVGVATHRDYGAYMDEMFLRYLDQRPLQRVSRLWSGDASRDAALYGAPLNSHECTHGVVFEGILCGLQSSMEQPFPGVTSDVLHMRHLVTFLVFFLGLVAFADLCRRIFRSASAGIVAALFLAAIPEIYCAAYVDSIDAPFLAFYTMATWTLFNFLDRPDPARATLHAAMTAVAAGVRLAAGLMVVVTLIMAAASLRRDRAALSSVLLYLAWTAVLTVLLTPVSWGDVVHVFLISISMSTNAAPETSLGVASPLYIPYVVATSVPILVVLMFCAGAYFSLRQLHARRAGEMRLRDQACCWLLLLLPVLASIAAGTRHYGGLRHFLFIYPPFVVFAIYGLRSLWRASRSLRPLLLLAGVAALLDVGSTYYQAHGYELVYTNGLNQAAGLPSAVSSTEAACLAEREALAQILARDRRSEIRLFGFSTYYVPGVPGRFPMCAMGFPRDQQARAACASRAGEANYVLVDGKGNCFPYLGYRMEPWTEALRSRLVEFYAITFRGRRVLTVYEMRPQ